ncbi:MAG TPA: M14 family metallopeptidase [Pyrinomonadaceae bacterium]|nr:peptidase M14 [Chloracidobacterium sp.]HQY68590.1 M14 family metallopeptidase [Pyrinomonadaceae bacterium]
MANVYSQSETGILPPAWQTTAEKTNYAKTSTYDEAVAYSKKLAAASGGLIVYKSYGKSGEGRDMPLLIAASGKAFTPEIASKQGKAVVLIQAGIHAGEIDGKDAGLALLRDIAITKTRLDLLKDVVILFEVIYNVDGHENSNPFMRMNQNGPDEMGFRANASNLNLNRDYMKADAPETRAWLGLWNRWRPDAFVDCHVTDGADFQYNLTYEYAHFQEVNPAVKNWMDEHFDGVVVPNVASEGNLLTHYIEFAGREVTSGIATFIATPRFATGYTPLRNRAGLLIETHVYKPYKSRVRGTYDTLRYFIEEIGKSKASLFAVNKTADDESSALGRTYDRNAKFPIVLGVTDKATEIAFKGLDYRIDDSPISGAKRLVYGTIPTDYTIKKFDDGKVVTAVAPPLAYIVPPQYKDVIDVLKLHGIKFTILKKAQTMDVESYKLTEPKWSTNSFENRITLSCKPLPIAETRTYAAGSVVVRLDQDTANVAIHLLEPAGPDSFVYWGFFNSIFEQKEYGESYQIEKVAVEMLAKDPKLKAEFETKLKDEGFAKNPRARLNFFYERSPYYLNQKIGVYPVGRIISHNHLQ